MVSFCAVPGLEDVEGFLFLALVGVEAFAVVVVLDAVKYAAW